jgi:hypothetical protein
LSRKIGKILKETSIKVNNIERKNAFHLFLKNLNLHLVKIKKLNKSFLLKNLFLNFFKKTCKHIITTQTNKKKIQDIEEFYSYKLKNKIFKKLLKSTEIRQNSNGKKIRKFLIRKILFKNIKELYDFRKKKYIFYRKLHLKKHFIKKWKFCIFMKKNIKLANLKFVSKFILNWKRSLLKIKEEKIEASIKLIKFFEKIQKKNNFICRKYVFIKFFNFKELYRKLLRKREKENIFIFKREIKIKKIILQYLRINIANNKFLRKIKFIRLKYSINKIRDECIYSITKRLKRIGYKSKVDFFRSKFLKQKLKKLLLAMRALIKNKNEVMIQFRSYFLRKNIFDFLKDLSLKEKNKDNLIIDEFKIRILKQKAFNSIKENLFYSKRQKKILFEMNKFFLRCKKRKLRSIIKDWKRFYICEKFMKFKTIQKRIKIFYLLKYICNKAKVLYFNNYDK